MSSRATTRDPKGFVATLPPRLRNGVEQPGHMAQLLVQVLSTAIRNPRGYWGDVRDDMRYLVKKLPVPATFALLGFGFLPATWPVVFLLFLGAPNRVGTVYLSFIVREAAPFIVGVIVAGVIGAATTSELGARKIREELDALRVLGQDPIRLLVLPRVISLTIITAALSVFGIVPMVIEGLLIVVTLGDTSAGSFLSSFTENLTVPELAGIVLKMTLVGLFIGIVCASKGLTARPGAEGVGRAVNEAVVISVLAVFIIDVVFNMILLGNYPDMRVLR